jgi:hypothetical protein
MDQLASEVDDGHTAGDLERVATGDLIVRMTVRNAGDGDLIITSLACVIMVTIADCIMCTWPGGQAVFSFWFFPPLVCSS